MADTKFVGLLYGGHPGQRHFVSLPTGPGGLDKQAAFCGAMPVEHLHSENVELVSWERSEAILVLDNLCLRCLEIVTALRGQHDG